MNRHKEKIKFAVKTGLGFGLVGYVLHSRMIDFHSLGTTLFNPVHLVIAFGFLLFSALCCTARWLLIAQAQGLSLSFKKLFSLTMIGSFFNTFMPGSVGGDLIKAWYVAGQEPQRKTKAVFTVLLDRALGLAVILFYSAFTLLFYTQWLTHRKELQVIAVGIWAFTLVSILFGILFFMPHVWEWKISQAVVRFLMRFEKLKHLIEAAILYRHHFTKIFYSIILSAFSVLGLNLFYYVLGRSMGISLSLPQYFFIVPLALTFSAIPLLPGGVGTGQVAFYTLFLWMGAADPTRGGALCTVYQVYSILFNCLGAFFYLRFKRKAETLPQGVRVSSRSATPAL